jgi:hypothetical protein
MNRAWIPAGALAGVSVAGLIALGQLTDSLGTPVSFHPTLAVTTPAAGQTRVVPVSVDQGTSGTTATDTLSAALKVVRRGGEATVAAATPSADAGEVGFHRTSSSSQTRATTTFKSTTVKPKKTVKRAASIGNSSGPNGDNGLAGGSSGSSSTSVGAQSGTPGSETP